jgi:hypothetical protein
MRIAILAIIVLFSHYLNAQNDSTATKGEVQDGEVIIEKEKKITLPKADKIFKKANLKSFNSDALNLKFQIFEPTFDWPRYKSDVPFQRIDKKYPSPEYQSFVKLGFGNYSSPLLEAAVFQQLSKFKLSSGLIYESFASGPVNKEFSSSSNVKFDLAATYQGNGFSIIPYFGLTNQQFKFYGNTNRINSGFSSETPEEGLYNSLVFGSRIDGRKKGLDYFLDAKVNKASQKLSDGILLNKEPSVQAIGGLSVKIDTAFTVGFDIEGYSSNYQSGFSYDRSLFEISPWVRHAKNDLTITAGLRVASSTSFNSSVSGLYPFINGELVIGSDWSVYGNVDGGLNWNDLDQFLTENQFLDDSLIVLNTETNLLLGGGIKGELMKNLKLDVGVSGVSLNNLPLYVPSENDSSRFILIYDSQSSDVVTFKMKATYSPNSTSTYGASLELNNYTFKTIDKPWHLPNFQMKLNSSHNINQKLIFSVDIISLIGIKAPSNTSFGYTDLAAIIDVNIYFNYLINNRLSTFISTNNLLNNEYERYIGYPVRGITFKIGGKYRF